MLQRLLDIGFRKVGEWRLSAGIPRCILEAEQQSTNILYSFALKHEVLYVGKTTASLRKRMYGYEKPGPTQSTNKTVQPLIAALLHQGEPIFIYALPDHGLLKYGGFHLNLAAGLEDSIVFQLKPKWNRRGVGSATPPLLTEVE